MIPLYDLALDALGSLIFDITVKLGELLMDKQFDFSTSLQQTVNYMEDMVLRNVPPSLATEVTSRLQSYIFRAVKVIYKKLQVESSISKCQDLQEEIIVSMWLAIVHPSIKSFDFSFETFRTSLGLSYSSELCKAFLHKVFAKAINVSVVKLEYHLLSSREVTLNSLCRLENLVELTLQGCTDATLIAVSEKCSKLKKLDIRESDVCDESVPAIVKFNCLRYLDIRATYMSTDGVTYIIKKMSHLKVLNSLLTVSQVMFLEDTNPNLSSLGLHLLGNCNSIPLRFKNLTCLSISFRYAHGQSFLSLKESLVEMGPRLLELRLDNVEDTDLHFIADKCPSLKQICLCFERTRYLGFPDIYRMDVYRQQYPLPVFTSVKCCEFRLDNCCLIQHIMSSFVNVQKVVLNQLSRPFCFLFKQILDGMKEGFITELYVRENRFKLSGCKLLIYRADGSVYSKSVEQLESTVKDILDMKGLEYSGRDFITLG